MIPDEIFDVCNEHDEVVSQATRAHVHANDLLHRAVHIWIVNSKNELLVHYRSEGKDQYPHCYTSSASGHLDAGETYEQAAHRELKEELDLAGDLTFVTKLSAGPETAFEHSALYLLKTDHPPKPDPGEIERIEYWTISAAIAFVAENPIECTPPFRELIRWWDRSDAGVSILRTLE